MNLDANAAPAAPRQLAGDPDWWRGGVIYQIYPRSFLDTNGDGIGDLKGVTQKLDYVASLNVDAIWLSPFFVSPMDDFGYDVADYRDIDPMFGTLRDFDEMLAAAHKRGLRILIDLVLSHTSDRHPWFAQSRKSRDNPRADWYVWADPKADGTPPTNWLAMFGGPAWEWDSTRRQYYMHNFLTSQPDLNYHNEAVQDAILDVARFWLDRGVDGFRLDTVNKYVHDKELRDNPPMAPGMSATVDQSNPIAMQQPIYSINRPENLAFVERLRALLDEYPGTTTVGEIGNRMADGPELGQYTAPGRLHMAYSFDLLHAPITAPAVRTAAERAETLGASWTSWPFSNHDVVRVVSRAALGERSGPMLLQLMMCLHGTPTMYQGDELGLTEADVPFELIQDPYGRRFWPEIKGRDGCRTPMPWRGGSEHAGFSTGDPWLPVAGEHAARAVDRQEQDPVSDLNRTRAFVGWRRAQTALTTGSIAFLDEADPVIAFTRTDADGTVLVCAFNISQATAQWTAPFALRLLDVPGMEGATLDGSTLAFDPLGAAIAVKS
ncbi:alpha glucosidase [Acuticoccus sp. MNP-M23]|uniref:alpha-glucosidase n=1 Tax=Acuticoccus sp. MNP-M23 TaxID=3072793 RepID=UPI00281528A2|nr:alpha glucosidase [Acuticoccus sp. MNP-M23]WMS43978.1 alpha glucosidase [Acuticoccus sp. MNP-M23]